MPTNFNYHVQIPVHCQPSLSIVMLMRQSHGRVSGCPNKARGTSIPLYVFRFQRSFWFHESFSIIKISQINISFGKWIDIFIYISTWNALTHASSIPIASIGPMQVERLLINVIMWIYSVGVYNYITNSNLSNAVKIIPYTYEHDAHNQIRRSTTVTTPQRMFTVRIN